MGEEKILNGGKEKNELDYKGSETSKEKYFFERANKKSKEAEEKEDEKINGIHKRIRDIAGGLKDQELVDSDEKDIDVKERAVDIKDLPNAEDRINRLVEIAVQEGPKRAVEIARTLNDNFSLDQLHDQMIDDEELRKRLEEKGLDIEV